MSPGQSELNALIWRFGRGVAALFLAFVAGWALTACLLGLASGAVSLLPVWLRAVVFLGVPLLGGAAAALLWHRFAGFPAARPAPPFGMPEGVGCFLVVCLGLSFIGLFPIVHGLHKLTHHRWLGSFQPAGAVVTGTRIDEVELGGLKGLAPRVLYEFRVGEKQHAGYKIHWGLQLPGPPEASGDPPPDNVIWSRHESACKSLIDLLGPYPVSKKVTAYHDPDDPDNACLVYVPFVPTQHGIGLWYVLGVLVLLWTISLSVWMVTRRRAAALLPPGQPDARTSP